MLQTISSSYFKHFKHAVAVFPLTVCILLCWLLLSSSSISAQTLQWQAQYNGFSGELDEATAIKTDAAGNVYVTGTSKFGDTDIITIKYNAAGVSQWTVRYDVYYYNSDYGVYAHTEDKGTDLQIDAAGNVYVSGTSYKNTNCQQVSAVTIKYNASGVKQWEINTAYASCRPAEAIGNPHSAIDASGNVYVTASVNSDFGNGIDIEKISPAGVSLWSRTYNYPDTYGYQANAIALDASGNVYIAGYLLQANGNYLTLKYNNVGTLQWQAQYNGPSGELDVATAIKADAAGNVYVTGTSKFGDTDIITIKYNAAGVSQWTVRYDEYFYDSEGGIYRHTEDKGTDIQIDASGNTYVSGTSYYNRNCNNTIAILLKYNALGAQQWKVTTATSDCGAALDGPHSAIDASGNVYETESGYRSGLTGSITTNKVSPAGTLLWTRAYTAPDTFDYQANAICIDSPGNVYVAGRINQSTGNGNYLTLKYEAQLTRRINTGGPALATSLGVFSADAYSTGATVTGSSAAAIAATTDDALYQNYRRGNTLGGSFGYNIPVVNGNYTVKLHFAELNFTTAGQRKFNVSAEGVAWLSNYDIAADGGVNTAKVKTRAVTVTDGNLTLNFTSLINYALVSAIEVVATPAPSARESAEEEALVAAATQLQAYPNPFTDKVTISFTLPETSPAKLEVYNLQGKLVKRLFDGEAEGGKLYELEMDGSGLNNGLYISRLATPAQTESKKIVLAR
ncbi:MAG: malectin domain-containing carbohydrate-binding protein [Bacteroidota bacterium]